MSNLDFKRIKNYLSKMRSVLWGFANLGLVKVSFIITVILSKYLELLTL